MSIFNLLNEHLFAEEGYQEARDWLQEELDLYGDVLEEAAKLERVPQGWKKTGSSDRGRAYEFVVNAKPQRQIPKQRSGESDEEWQERTKEHRERDFDDTPRDYTISVLVSYNCNNNAIGISFQDKDRGYVDLNMNKPRSIMYGVTYSVADAIKDAPCDIEKLQFSPITSPNDTDKNRRSAIYKLFVDKYVPALGRTVERMDPASGIGPSITVFLDKKEAEPEAEQVDLMPLIQDFSMDELRAAIEAGTQVTNEHLLAAMKTTNTEMVREIAKHTPVTQNDLLVASQRYPEILIPLIGMAEGDINFKELIWGLIKQDKVDILKVLHHRASGQLEFGTDALNTAIANRSMQSFEYIMSELGDGAKKDAMKSAMENDNIDIVKMLIDGGFKITPDIVKIPTSKEIKAYLAKKMWNR